MGKRDDKKRSKRQALLDAALQLFTDQGFNKTSVLDITQRSGMAKGTFYLYFKDKYDIRNELVAYQSRLILEEGYHQMRASGISGLEEQIIFVADYAVTVLESRQDLLALISKNLSLGILRRGLNQPLPEDTDGDCISAFQRLTSPFGIPAEQAEIMLYLLLELISSSCYSPILYSEPCTLEALKPYLYESVRRIIRQFSDGTPGPDR